MKVTVNVPTSPAGEVLDLPLLGSFENGTTTEIPEDRVARYLQETGLEEAPDEIIVGAPVEESPEAPGADQGEPEETAE